MSWSIANIDNTVILNEDAKRELLEIADFINMWHCSDDPFQDDYLWFSLDHQEHMDYLTPEMLEVLARNNCVGDITFGSMEGDNQGSFWGYRIYGDGSWVELEGELEFKVKM